MVLTICSVADEVQRYPNVTVVKSMSKDFGVAGFRAGYAGDGPLPGESAAG